MTSSGWARKAVVFCAGYALRMTCAVLVLVVIISLLPRDGYGQVATETEKNVRVVQQKPLVRYHRAEVVPSFTLALNEVLTRHIGVGGVARFYITEEWSAGLEYIKYFGRDASLANEISAFGVANKTRLMNQYFGAQGSWVPVDGKFLFFGKGPVYWDFHFLAGLGATQTGASAYRVTGSIGAGFRFLLWRFLTLGIEVRDYMYRENYNPEKRFTNNVVLTCGLGVFVPFSYEYKFPK